MLEEVKRKYRKRKLRAIGGHLINMPRRYSRKSQEEVKSAMHKFKRGKLKSSSGRKVKNPKQAIAIGLSEARQKGAKIPSKRH